MDEHNAIHGLVRWAVWNVAERETHRVVMEHVLHPRPGYPFSLGLAHRLRALGGGSAGARRRPRTSDRRPCPYGTGAHPYLTAGTERVDSAVLRAPARTVLLSDERGIPTGDAPVEGTEYDFRRPRPIGRTRLDHCFKDLERDSDGRARVELRNEDAGNGVELWVDEGYPYLMLFTGDPVPDVQRRSLAVEPMTCPPNAFRTGRDLILLNPGSTVTTTWGIHLSS